MHVSWKTGVTLPTYRDAQIDASMRRRIQEATDDDLLSALLHYAEGHVALAAYRGLDSVLRDVRYEEEQAKRLRGDDESPLCFEYRQANYRLTSGLRALASDLEVMRGAVAQCWLSLLKATTGDLNHRYREDADPAESGLDAVAPFLGDVGPQQRKLEIILAQHADETHGLALRDATYAAFAATPDSVSLEQFNEMSPLEFELAIASLLQRDNYLVNQRNGGARDLGADVIATTPDGRKIVFQCKHRQPGGRPLGSPVIQTLNGTARPVHKADIVIAVTNASFTTPARSLAREQDIHLLHGQQLRKWATWGVPLLTVLGVKTEIAQEAA